MYQTNGIYLITIKKKERYYDTEPFCFGFSLSEMEHEKGVSYPTIKHIIFDEFLTRTTYLKDEFILFMNVLSTIIRNKNDVRIYMLGNTVNKFSPYFSEMGLKNVENQKQGTIDLYRFGNDNVHINIAVEYCSETETKKESNKYFCFGNERLEMITGGKWELAAYPQLPYKYQTEDILYIFYIKFGDNLLQGNILNINNNLIIYIHVKTSLIGIDSNERIVYDLVSNPKPNYFRKLLNNSNKICSTITYLFANDKVYYQNNTVGDIVRNYLLQSMKNNLTI